MGDTSGEEIWEGGTCGGEMEEADTSVPDTTEVSMSRRSWSNETSDSVATVGAGVAGICCSIADDDAGEGIAER